MADVDAITRLLELGSNAVFLMLLWRVYQDFMSAVNRHANYLEKLVDRHMEDDEPPPQASRSTAPLGWSSRTPTELREAAGAD